MVLEEGILRLSQEKAVMKEEIIQTRKLDVLEGMLATLFKGKTSNGTSDCLPTSPASSNVVGESSMQRFKTPVELALEQQLSVKQIELPKFNGEDPVG